ncbi:MAG: serine/threonine-protein kinase [Planctomycetota bacterium]
MAEGLAGSQETDFLSVAVREGMLEESQAEKIRSDSERTGVSASALCIESGLMQPIQADVVSGLLEPEDVAPGHRVTGLLGHGGLGIVYRAYQEKLDRTVALKTIPIHRIESTTAVGRFQQEARAIGRLKHPNIVAAYDFGTHRERLYLSMELVEGIDLDDQIKLDGRMDEVTAWALAEQVAAGLAHADSHGIVHRDIKPANLLLTEAPAGYPLPPGVPLVKVSDFGLVQLDAGSEERARLTVSGTSMGTPHYMAPEQISDPSVGREADIYALGATVFHMISGAPPFPGKTMGQVLSAKLQGSDAWGNALPVGVSDASIGLLRDMLAKDPAERVSNYETLLERIRAVRPAASSAVAAGKDLGEMETLDSISIDTDVATEAAGLPKKTQPSLRFVLLGLVALVCFGVAGGALLSLGRTPAPRLTRTAVYTSLFNGQDLNDWTAERGRWSTFKDDMGSGAMRGKGSIVRMIELAGMSAERPCFGVSLGVGLKEAESFELHFGHEDYSNRALPRSVLRVDREGVQLGTRPAKDGDFSAVSALIPWEESPDEAEGYLAVGFEAQPGEWLALVDGKAAASMPRDATANAPVVQLVVQGGEAAAVDVEAYLLGPKP